MRPITTITPKLPPQAFKTYSIVVPKETHWKKVPCAETNCEAFVKGWTTSIDERTQQGQKQAYYIRKHSGRSFKEERNREGLTEFRFSTGQQCFREHQERLDKPELFIVQGGDYRQRFGQRLLHKRAADWVDDFSTHQGRLNDNLSRG